MRRREFLAVSALVAQGGAQQQTNFAPMDVGAYRAVLRPPKANAVPSMDDAGRDQVEHKLRCVCGCSLDVYTCRTTDFTCPVSPAMHRDIRALIAGGYTADEILDAFTESYGELVLMAPKREGFNLVGYATPFVAMAAGATVVTFLLRRWTRAAAATQAAALTNGATPPPARVQATPDELARIAAAVRDEERDET